MTYPEFKEKYGLRLNAQQDAAVQATEGDVLLLAVPGSGKTTVLVSRLAYMILAKGVRAENILAMTYTVAAARDMKKRFVSFFGEEAARGLEFRTINSLAAEIIRRYSRFNGSEAFELIEEKDQAALLSEIFRAERKDFATDADISSLRTDISYAKNMLLKGAELEKMDREQEGFSRMFEGYKKQMVQKRLMDFDDQLVYAHSILRRYPEILNEYRVRFPFICVDEAQDSSKLQHEIISLLSKGGSLFMVGDEDQSIYRFRAAFPEALLSFGEKRPGAKVLLMEENFRSRREICDAALRFIAQNKSRREKSIHAHRGEGGRAREIPAASRNAQYAYLTKIAENCSRDTAVLYRDNDCALPLIDRLERAGISYRCRQLDSSFFTHRVLRDVRDIIDFSKDQSDGYVFMRIYYKLGAGISKALAEQALKTCGEGQSLLDCVARNAAAPVWLKKNCRSLMQDMEKLHHESAGDAIYRIIEYMGYREYLDRTGADSRKCDILETLAEAEPSLDRFLERLDELCEIVKRGSADPDSLFCLSTVHSAKGLEFERVYLMDVIDGILPCAIREDEEKAEETLEEERRLFYVAMTRAKDELNVFTFRRGQSTFSDFLFEKQPKAENRQKSTIKPPSAEKTRLSWEKKDFIPGTRVKHKTYGSGSIIAVGGDLMQICFDSGEQKQLMLSLSLKLKLISIEK